MTRESKFGKGCLGYKSLPVEQPFTSVQLNSLQSTLSRMAKKRCLLGNFLG